MPKSLHEQVSELEAELEQGGEINQTEEDNDTGIDKSGEAARSKRHGSTAEERDAEQEEQRQPRKRGRDGERSQRGASGRGRDDGDKNAKPSRKTSQNEGEDASDDGETSRGDGRRASRSGGTPRRDAGRTDGRGPVNDEAFDEDQEEDDREEHGDAVANARLRRENREMQAELKRLRGEAGGGAQPKPAEAKQPTEEERRAADAAKDPEPDRGKDPNKWTDWKIRQQDKEIAELRGQTTQTVEQTRANEQVREATEEFKGIRDRYIQKNPDFVPAFKHGFERYAEALSLTNPNWSRQQIVRQADYQLLMFASDCAKKGVDPAEAIYDMCIERFGYKPGSAKRQEQPRQRDQGEEDDRGGRRDEREARRRPNLRLIDSNRRRSASGLGSGGQGGSARLTKEAAADMTLGELANLDTDMWADLERMS